MATTLQQLMETLQAEEPDYMELKKMEPNIVPHLLTIVREADPLTASKAAYLASLIHSNVSSEVLSTALNHDNPVVRIAAASGTRNLDVLSAKNLLFNALQDRDSGVRKMALKSIEARPIADLIPQVESLIKSDPDPLNRRLAFNIRER
jgi:hypothetical protein